MDSEIYIDPFTPHFRFQTLTAGGAMSWLEPIYELRYSVYCLECEFLSADDYPDGKEIDHYDVGSTHFAAVNTHDELVGAVRLVTYLKGTPFPFQAHGLKIFDDVGLPPRHLSAEISRLVVRRDFRRRTSDSLYGTTLEASIENSHNVEVVRVTDRRERPEILLGLFRQMYRFSKRNGIRYWYAAMERALARSLQRLHFRFVPIGPTTDYYGPVTPYVADLHELETSLRLHDPKLLKWFSEEE